MLEVKVTVIRVSVPYTTHNVRNTGERSQLQLMISVTLIIIPWVTCSVTADSMLRGNQRNVIRSKLVIIDLHSTKFLHNFFIISILISSSLLQDLG